MFTLIFSAAMSCGKLWKFVQHEKVEFGLTLLIILLGWLIPVGFSIQF